MSEGILGLEFGKPRAPSPLATNGDQRQGASRPDDPDAPPPSKRSRHRKTVGFDSVTVYYFQRMQGFTCVPSQGGSTLGMSPMHTEKRTFSLRQHAHERRRLHFADLDSSNTSSSSLDEGPSCSSGGDPYHEGLSSADSPPGEMMADSTDEDEDDAEEADPLSYLQPVPTRQRRAMLRASGVRKIDALEKEECRDIRASREFCGCACRGRCLPDNCSCSLAGIACQVDRLSFPCGCTQEGCGNTSGRTEFNPVRVRAHFLHTLMRLELEQQQAAGSLAAYRHVDPRRLLYYGAANGVAPGAQPPPTAVATRYSSEEDEEGTSYSENSDYSTEEEEEDGGRPTEAAAADLSPPRRDYTDLSCAVARGGRSSATLASRGLVPVDPVFVGCGDCATDGLLPASPGGRTSPVATTEDGSSSTATTDSTFGEIIKASLGEVATL